MIRLPRLPEPVLRVLLDIATEQDLLDDDVLGATFFYPSLEQLWVEHRRSLLAIWTEEYPGTRPSLWWRIDAPDAPFAHRAILGGSGRACAVTPTRGVPHLVGVNAAAPPLIEAEAEFLRRHGLLLPGEEQRLRPSDFEPEEFEP